MTSDSDVFWKCTMHDLSLVAEDKEGEEKWQRK